MILYQHQKKSLKKFILNIYEIKKYNLEYQYNSVFDNFKKLNINYYSLSISLNFDNEVNYLDELNIDFKNLKRLELNFINDVNKVKPLQKILFSNINLEKNLQYLHLQLSGEIIDYNLFENINNFQSLTELNIERCNFNEIIILELPNLINLNISYCHNLSLSNNSTLNIKKLFFYKFTLIKIGIQYRFPKLEECRSNIPFIKLIDLSTLKYLKKLVIDSKSDIILYDLQKEIPSLISLDIILSEGEELEKKEYNQNIEIIESQTSKVKDLSLTIDNSFGDVKFYINKFENLAKFKLNINNENKSEINPVIFFPIFKTNCFITFNYLRIFEFCTYKNKYNYISISNQDIDSLYANLNQMTNLKYFKFKTISNPIQLNFYKNFIKNLLELEIKEIELDIKNKNKLNDKEIDYSEDELKKINPLFDSTKFKKIIIRKLNCN